MIKNMAKKKEEDKRKKLIKFLVTEREFKTINRYAGVAFQNKSEFIRTAIHQRIAEIDKSILPASTDPRFIKPHPKNAIMKELKSAQEKKKNLEKPNEKILKKREEEKKKRKEDLEEEKKKIEEQLDIVNLALND